MYPYGNVLPAVKITAAAERLQQHGARASVAFGKHCLQKAGAAVVVADADFSAFYAVQKVLRFSLRAPPAA